MDLVWKMGMRPVCSILSRYQNMRVFVLRHSFQFLTKRVFVIFSWSKHKWASCPTIWVFLSWVASSVVVLSRLKDSSVCGIMNKDHLVKLWVLSLSLLVILVKKLVCLTQMLFETIMRIMNLHGHFRIKCVTLLTLFWTNILVTFNWSDVPANCLHVIKVFFRYSLIKVENPRLICFDWV